MPKIKTNKALSKKVRLSKSGKVFRRSTGQNHFNAKEGGSVTRAKRSDKRLSKADEKNVQKAIVR